MKDRGGNRMTDCWSEGVDGVDDPTFGAGLAMAKCGDRLGSEETMILVLGDVCGRMVVRRDDDPGAW